MERKAAGRGRALRGPRRLERRRRLPQARTRSAGDRGLGRRLAPAQARAPGRRRPRGELARRRERDGDAWWCPLTPTRALRARRRPRPRRRQTRVDVTTVLRRAHDLSARRRARCSRASARSTCARRSRRPAASAPARSRASPGMIVREADGPLPAAVRLGASASTCGRSWTTPRRSLGGGPIGVERSPGPEVARVLDIFRKRRMWRRQGELQALLRRRDRRRRLARAGDRVLPPKEHGIRNVAVLEKRYIGSGAAGRNTTILRSNYKTPEGARFYDASVKLYEGLSQELELQPAVLAVRPPHARALRPRDVRDGQPRRGQPPATGSTRA